MKIAVPVTINGLVDEHFGHCEFYNIYTISENNEIQNVQSIKSVEGCGCKSNIANVLAESGVTMMLAGGIGGGARVGPLRRHTRRHARCGTLWHFGTGRNRIARIRIYR